MLGGQQSESPVDDLVSEHRFVEKVFLVSLGGPERSLVGGEVGHGLKNAPLGSANVGEVGGLHVANLEFFAGIGDVLDHPVGSILSEGEESIHEDFELNVLHLLLGQLGSFLSESILVLHGEVEGVLGFGELGFHDAHVLRGPRPLSGGESEVESVLADDAGGSGGDPDGALSVVGVGEDEVVFELVPDDFRIRHAGEEPDLFSATEGTGGFVLHAFPEQSIGEAEGFDVLNDLVLAGYDAEDFVVGIADVGDDVGDRDFGAVEIEGFGLDGPVEARLDDGFI